VTQSQRRLLLFTDFAESATGEGYEFDDTFDTLETALSGTDRATINLAETAARLSGSDAQIPSLPPLHVQVVQPARGRASVCSAGGVLYTAVPPQPSSSTHNGKASPEHQTPPPVLAVVVIAAPNPFARASETHNDSLEPWLRTSLSMRLPATSKGVAGAPGPAEAFLAAASFQGRVRRGGYAQYIASIRALYADAKFFLLWNNVDLWGDSVWPEPFIALLDALEIDALLGMSRWHARALLHASKGRVPVHFAHNLIDHPGAPLLQSPRSLLQLPSESGAERLDSACPHWSTDDEPTCLELPCATGTSGDVFRTNDSSSYDPDKIAYVSGAWKGLDQALLVLERALAVRPTLVLHVASPQYGAARIADGRLQAMVRSRPGIFEHNVVERGALKRAALSRLMASSLAVVQPSLFQETYGSAHAEAQALGTPVLRLPGGASEEVLSPVDAQMERSCSLDAAAARLLEWRAGARPRVALRTELRHATLFRRSWAPLLQAGTEANGFRVHEVGPIDGTDGKPWDPSLSRAALLQSQAPARSRLSHIGDGVVTELRGAIPRRLWHDAAAGTQDTRGLYSPCCFRETSDEAECDGTFVQRSRAATIF
jgi:glycosyltransferase involved in cell wall biosynthesis